MLSGKIFFFTCWVGGVDVVGGAMFVIILVSFKHSVSVVVTGLVGGRELVITVIFFLLCGVNLLGIDIVQFVMECC